MGVRGLLGLGMSTADQSGQTTVPKGTIIASPLGLAGRAWGHTSWQHCSSERPSWWTWPSGWSIDTSSPGGNGSWRGLFKPAFLERGSPTGTETWPRLSYLVSVLAHMGKHHRKMLIGIKPVLHTLVLYMYTECIPNSHYNSVTYF